MKLKKIHHLIRYFFVIGVLSFVCYIKDWGGTVPLALFGPVLYLAHMLKSFIIKNIWPLQSSQTINYYGLLLPLALVYFSFLGFQLKQLWNERGQVRVFILVIFAGFVGYIHLMAWKNLTAYFLLPRVITALQPHL